MSKLALSAHIFQQQFGTAFAGNCEFSTLAAVADILPNSSLVDIVFYRSPTMLHAVECDKQGCSNYAMCASHVGKTFDDTALREIVNTIANDRDCLLEIMNFNIEVASPIFLVTQLLIFLLGSIICLHGKACCIVNSHQCFQLLQGAEG
jgi:hypothetical protein